MVKAIYMKNILQSSLDASLQRKCKQGIQESLHFMEVVLK